MKSFQSLLLLTFAGLFFVACKRTEIGQAGGDLLPSAESLAGQKDLPQVTDFAELTGEDFFKTVAARDRIVVVEFYSESCAPCRQLSSVMEKLARKGRPGVQFAKISTDDFPALAQEHAVRLTPDTRVFHAGQELGGFIGVRNAVTLDYLVEQYLASVPRSVP